VSKIAVFKWIRQYGVKINQTNHSKALGLNIDENLLWKEHIHAISKKVASSIGERKASQIFYFSCPVLWVLLYILIQPHFDYYSVVWNCLSRPLRKKLQKPQNRAVRVISKWSYDTNPCYLFRSALSWDNVSVRWVKRKTNVIYKCFNKLAPVYLCNMFIPRALSLFFDKNCIYRNASVTVMLPCGKIFQRMFALQKL